MQPNDELCFYPGLPPARPSVHNSVTALYHFIRSKEIDANWQKLTMLRVCEEHRFQLIKVKVAFSHFESMFEFLCPL